MGVSRREVLRLGLGAAATGLLAGCALDTTGAPGSQGSDGLVFYSAQLATTEEAEAVRRQILAAFPREVQFAGDSSAGTMFDRVLGWFDPASARALDGTDRAGAAVSSG
ncbi:hypothetical protein ACQP04_19045 [Pseudonocardia halophobica]|uniref:hypothetical protein n=1 Tax=Pseudonocardia halophobica TaxID=29401 RepID=UPI003D914760